MNHFGDFDDDDDVVYVKSKKPPLKQRIRWRVTKRRLEREADKRLVADVWKLYAHVSSEVASLKLRVKELEDQEMISFFTKGK
jgi:hypothetical protein